MTTGTGLVLLGIWATAAAAWHSSVVPGRIAWILTFLALGMTLYLK